MREASILLVDDDDDDVLLAQEGFKRAKFLVNIDNVKNGKDCMSYLRKEGPYAAKPTPDIILLDLNMPLMDGREVLKEIVADPQLNSLPVVVLTTSNAEADILEMYRLRCSSYIVKPVDFTKFQKAIENLTNYWFTLVSMPSTHKWKF